VWTVAFVPPEGNPLAAYLRLGVIDSNLARIVDGSPARSRTLRRDLGRCPRRGQPDLKRRAAIGSRDDAIDALAPGARCQANHQTDAKF